MAYKFNALTGTLDLVGSGGTPPVSTTNFYTQKFTLSAPQATAKSVNLANAPTDASKTVLVVRGAAGTAYLTDFIVSGTTLSWGGLALDGLLSTGDEITVLHN